MTSSAAQQGVAQLRVLSRSCTPVSNVASLQVDVLPGVDFIAFATSDGCIVLQQAAAPPEATSPTAAGQRGGAAVPGMPSAGRAPVMHGQFITACVLDDQSSSRGSRPTYSWVAWGGGPAYLLCAASEHVLHFFCLRHFFVNDAPAMAHAAACCALQLADAGAAAGLAAADSGSGSGLMSGVPPPRCCWPLVASHRLTHPLLTLEWTQNATGVLMSDIGQGVTMLEVEAGGVDTLHVLQGGMPEVSVRVAWTACSDTTQPLAAAGWAPHSPSATAHSRTTAGSTGMQHRILIWWPRTQPPAPQARPAAPPQPSSTLAVAARASSAQPRLGQAALPPKPPLTIPPAPGQAQGGLASGRPQHPYAVGTEVVRHPVKVLGMQWSPPLWQPPAIEAAQPPPPPPPPRAVSALSKFGRSASAPSPVPGPPPPPPPPAEGQGEGGGKERLALLTVGGDWAVRIFVEVFMKDLLPAHLTHAAADPIAAAAAAAALSMSQFCLALVIEAPIPGLTSNATPGLRAAWARPLPIAVQTLHGQLPAGADDGAGLDDGVTPRHVLPAGMSHAAVTIASRVQWVVASVSVVKQIGPAHGPGGGGVELEESVFVWAVDGLHADGAGLQQQQQQQQPARPGQPTPRGAVGPRAVLWGREARQVAWLQPHVLAAARDARLHSHAYVVYPRGMPSFHVVEWWAMRMPGRGAEVRAVVVAATSQDAGHAACPLTGLMMEQVSHAVFPAAPGELRGLQRHPALPDLAAALSRDGRVGFWWLDPVEELLVVSARARVPPGVQLRACRAAATLDPCALQGMFGPVTAVAWVHGSVRVGVVGQGVVATHLAVAVAGTIYLYALLLPDMAALVPGSSPAGSWAVQVVAEVLRLPLPPGGLGVSHMLHAPGNHLLALVARLPGTSGGGTPHHRVTTSDGAPSPDSDTAWLAWQLLPSVVPPATGPQWAALKAAGPEPNMAPLASRPATSDPSSIPAGGSVTCLHTPSAQSGTLVTGSSLGAVHFWTLADTMPQLVHACWCDIPAVSGVTGLSAPTSPRDGRGGADLGPPGAARCLPVAVAVHDMQGLAAAATTYGPAGAEDALFLWRRTPARTAAAGSAAGGGSGSPPDQLLDVWALEEVAVLQDTPSCLAWLPTPTSLTALLAIGYASGLIEYYSPSRSGWCVVATYRAGDELLGSSTLLGRDDGSLAVAAGSHLLLLSSLLDTSASEGGKKAGSRLARVSRSRQLLATPGGLILPRRLARGLAAAAASWSAGQSAVTLGVVLGELAGPLPPHHPDILLTLLRCGKPALACRVLRVLITWLQRVAAELDTPGGGAAPTTAGTGGVAGLPAGFTVPPINTGVRDADRSMPPGPPALALPSLPLEELIEPSEWGSPWLAALQQLCTAPPAPRPTTTPIRAAASAAPLVGTPSTSTGAGNLANQTAHASGTLSMSAFPGFGAASGGGGVLPSTTDAGSGGSLASGMLDMSMFGDFGGGGGGAGGGRAPSVSASSHGPSRLGRGPSGSPSSAQAGPASRSAAVSTLETGQLDMSLFGGFGGMHTHDEGEEAGPGLDEGESGGAEGSTAPGAPSAAAAVSSGVPDMAAFGFAGFDGLGAAMDAPPPPPLPPPADDADRPLAALRGRAPASAPIAAPHASTGSQDTNLGAFGSLIGRDGVAASPLVSEPASLAPELNGAQDLVVFPRAPPATGLGLASAPGSHNASAAALAAGASGGDGGPVGQQPLSAHLLSAQEAASLQTLLNVDLQAAADGSGFCGQQSKAGRMRSEDGSAPRPPSLPSYLWDDDSRVAAARASRLRAQLQLTKEQAVQLVLLARALTSATQADLALATAASAPIGAALGAAPLTPPPAPLVSAFIPPQHRAEQGLGPRGGRGEGGDVVEGLDPPGQAFLLAARLAAAQEVLQGPGTTADSEQASNQGTKGTLAGVGVSVPGLGSSRSLHQLMRQGSSNVTSPPHPWPSSAGLGLAGRGLSTTGALGARGRPGSGLPPKTTSSLLSFSSLSGVAAQGGAARSESGGGSGRGGATSFWQRLGLLPGLDLRAVLQAAASGSQGALLAAALPHVVWDERQEVLASPGASAGAAFSTAASTRGGRPDMAWPLLRKLGVGLWLLDQPVLVAKSEELARAVYARHREPYECALLYLALNKRPILLNLFKQAGNRKLTDFLAKNFGQEEARLAAAKNAFALLGQHKYDMAAAFFLLAGSLRQAVGVLARERGEPQLALLVARLQEGRPGGPEGCRIIKEELMPLAEACPDPAAVPCLLWADGRPAEAVQVLALAYSPARLPRPDMDGRAAPLPAPRDPGLLDFLLSVGVKQLAGRHVPRTTTAGVAALALQCAQALERGGASFLALQALVAALLLLVPVGGGPRTSSSTGGGPHLDSGFGAEPEHVNTLGPGKEALQQAFLRLVAASLLPSCLGVAPPSAQGTVNDGSGGSSALEGVCLTPGWRDLALAQAHWLQGVAQQYLPAPCRLALPLDALLSLVARHVACAASAGQGALVPPPSVRYALHAAPVTSAAGPTPHGPPPPHDGRPGAQGNQPGGPRATPELAGMTPRGSNSAAASPNPSNARPPAPHTAGASSSPQPLASPNGSLHAPHPGLATSRLATSASGPPAGLFPATPLSSRAASGTSLGPLNSLGSGSVGGGLAPGSEKSLEPGTWRGGPGFGTALFLDPADVLSVEGDKCVAVGVCSALGAAALCRPKGEPRPLVAALGRAGLLAAEAQLLAPGLGLGTDGEGGDSASGGGRSPNAGRQASMFMGLLGQVLEHVRWTPDPWAAVTRQVGSPGSPRGGGGGGGGGPGSLGSPRMALRLGDSPTPQGGSPGQLTANAASTHTATLAVHPSRPLYLTGSSGDHVFLWQFGEPCSQQAYVPLLDPSPALVAGRQSTSGGGTGAWPASRDAADPDAASAALALAHAAPSRKQLLLQLLQSPGWDGAAALRYGAAGSRFVGVGAAGLVAVWRQDVPPGPGGLVYADWVHHCVAKRGHDVLPTDDACNQFIVCGRGDKGGVVSWWDTRVGSSGQCVAELRSRRGVPSCMQLVTGAGGGTLLVVGDDTGDVAAHDVRMLGGAAPVWSLAASQPSSTHPLGGSCTALATWGPDHDVAGLVLPRAPGASQNGSAAGGAPIPATPSSTPIGRASSSQSMESAALSGGGAVTQHTMQASSQGGGPPSGVRLRQLVAAGGRDGSVLLLDGATGGLVQVMDRVHWTVKRGPFGMLGSGDRTPVGAAGRAPPNATGVPVTGLTACEGGLVSCGADGVVRYHALSGVWGARA